MGSGASTWLAILAGGPGGEEIRFRRCSCFILQAHGIAQFV
jgi:hypothetical protein